jgi:hypothetical protein
MSLQDIIVPSRYSHKMDGSAALYGEAQVHNSHETGTRLTMNDCNGILTE